MKCRNQPALECPIDAIGARARPMVAFSGFYESHKPPPSGDVRGIVPPHRHGHRNGQQSGYMLHHCFICCRPGGRRGNTEQVVTQWRRPVASDEALFILHREMHSVRHQRSAIAIEIASDGAAFVPRRRLFLLL
jgi:hypothetical protein